MTASLARVLADLGDGFAVGGRREQALMVAARNAASGVLVLEALDAVAWPAPVVDELDARVRELAAVYGLGDRS